MEAAVAVTRVMKSTLDAAAEEASKLPRPERYHPNYLDASLKHFTHPGRNESMPEVRLWNTSSRSCSSCMHRWTSTPWTIPPARMLPHGTTT
eukprot:1793733-Pyramimonas_sp.AAC.1